MTARHDDDRTDDRGQQFDIVAVASSAGGIRALTTLLGGLPATFPVPVLVVQHLDPKHDTTLVDVLARRCELEVRFGQAGAKPEAGVVYVAPPDQHLVMRPGGRLTLSHGERVHFVRPSADMLFESVARALGPRVIACVLTGSGSDGAQGVSAIKACGGTVIVEDPDTAQFTGMPQAAVKTGSVDFRVPGDEIAAVLLTLVEKQGAPE
ncbi:two-component system chemotaxis response regulator CheB [Herbihabitans rhizosphaerae]|uniref:protein-glutamate methylesterase n=1 Tax=Herbihabitans rhizosphaerae TaxID=1872711 RepID=A0A4Q7KCD2_9PSEU|nr:chemotaxis protein CheB [Herbihabitans rhizosphaerae]RZS30494.1 two-component system chemotaxis response regulator CheB [Herbihabitans rhizosphaerae]